MPLGGSRVICVIQHVLPGLDLYILLVLVYRPCCTTSHSGRFGSRWYTEIVICLLVGGRKWVVAETGWAERPAVVVVSSSLRSRRDRLADGIIRWSFVVGLGCALLYELCMRVCTNFVCAFVWNLYACLYELCMRVCMNFVCALLCELCMRACMKFVCASLYELCMRVCMNFVYASVWILYARLYEIYTRYARLYELCMRVCMNFASFLRLAVYQVASREITQPEMEFLGWTFSKTRAQHTQATNTDGFRGRDIFYR